MSCTGWVPPPPCPLSRIPSVLRAASAPPRTLCSPNLLHEAVQLCGRGLGLLAARVLHVLSHLGHSVLVGGGGRAGGGGGTPEGGRGACAHRPPPPPNSHPRTRTHLEEARNLDARSDASLHLLLLLQLVLKGGGEHVGEEFERNLGRGQGGTWAFVCEGGAPHPLSPPRTFPLRTHRQQHLHEWHQHKHQEGHQAGGGASRGVQGRGGGRAACATPHPPSRALPLTGTCRPSCASAAGAHACKVEGASVCVWGGAECRQLRARGCPPPASPPP